MLFTTTKQFRNLDRENQETILSLLEAFYEDNKENLIHES